MTSGHFQGRVRVWWVLFFIMSTAGCAYNVATGRRELILIPTTTEISMGRDIHRRIASSDKFSTNKELVARIDRIGQKLARVSDRQDYQYHFFVIEKDELNAFTIPGGNIYIYTGLVNKLKSDDEIAAVLAHEIGHCAARHTIKKFQAAVGYDLIGGIILNEVGMQEQVRRIASMSSSAVMRLVFSAYGRQDEHESDKLGLKYMDLAGYDLDGMVGSFQVLEKESKGPDVPLILRTHPYISDRIKAVREEIQKIRSGASKASYSGDKSIVFHRQSFVFRTSK